MASNAISQVVAQQAIIKIDGAGVARLITADPPRTGDVLFTQYIGKDSKPHCCKKILAVSFKKEDASQEVATNEITGEEPIVSLITIPKRWFKGPFVGVAATGEILSARMSKEGGLIVLDNDGNFSKSEACISQEGFHLTEKNHDILKMHLYLGFGYGVENPTCK